jgi:hypothetical protein
MIADFPEAKKAGQQRQRVLGYSRIDERLLPLYQRFFLYV